VKLVATIGTTGTFERFTALLVAFHHARPEVEVVFQYGRGSAPGIPGAVEFLAREELLREMREADLVLCHGGSGSVRDALRTCGNVAIVPRRADCGEGVVDDHQLDLSRALEARGLVRVVNDLSDVLAALERGRNPTKPTTSPLPNAVVRALRDAMGE